MAFCKKNPKFHNIRWRHEDALETKIIQNWPQIRAVHILKGIDQSKGTPAADKKRQTLKKQKHILVEMLHNSASISLKVLNESSSYNFTGLSAEDTIESY